mmetsp:Transcript_26246/g.65626  ORF Transcript_26246/g.65626 Transcript_26246/m.65626 type:complete len:254 (+) Transcript_26246:103-864(+)
MSLQCLSIFLEMAIFSPTFVQTGLVSANLPKSCFTAMTRAPVLRDPMLTSRISPLVSFWTFACFASPSALTPMRRLSRKKLTSISPKMSGSLPTCPRTCPTMRSVRVRVGSIFVPTPMRPPGTAYWSAFFSAFMELMTETMGRQLTAPPLDSSLKTRPGRTSMVSPRRRTPRMMEPPATPPLMLLISSPGLLTSKERMTIMTGEEVKSRTGTGTFLMRFSTTTSMLYLSCAEMGMTGAFSATVSRTKALISAC